MAYAYIQFSLEKEGVHELTPAAVFQLGLIETLGGTDQLSPNQAHLGSSVFCRTVYYRRQTGVQIDIIQYYTFLSNNPSYPSIDRKLLEALYSTYARLGALQDGASDNIGGSRPSLNRRIAEVIATGPQLDAFSNPTGVPGPSTTASSATALSWQQNAPKIDVRVKQGGQDVENEPSAGQGAGAADAAPYYPHNFAKVVEALQNGVEVEGIRQIPDTIVRLPVSPPLQNLAILLAGFVIPIFMSL